MLQGFLEVSTFPHHFRRLIQQPGKEKSKNAHLLIPSVVHMIYLVRYPVTRQIHLFKYQNTAPPTTTMENKFTYPSSKKGCNGFNCINHGNCWINPWFGKIVPLPTAMTNVIAKDTI